VTRQRAPAAAVTTRTLPDLRLFVMLVPFELSPVYEGGRSDCSYMTSFPPGREETALPGGLGPQARTGNSSSVSPEMWTSFWLIRIGTWGAVEDSSLTPGD